MTRQTSSHLPSQTAGGPCGAKAPSAHFPCGCLFTVLTASTGWATDPVPSAGSGKEAAWALGLQGRWQQGQQPPDQHSSSRPLDPRPVPEAGLQWGAAQRPLCWGRGHAG